MLWIPQKGRLLVEQNLGTVGDSTPGSQITTGAAASTKGTPVEIFAATAFDAYMIFVGASEYGSSATNAKLMVDIMLGSSTEEIIIPDLIMGNNASGGLCRGYFFPLYIPAGSRISAKAAGQRTSTVFSLQVALYGGDGSPPFRVGRKVTTYGVSTVPLGTTVVPGTSGAAGSMTQIVASTSEEHFALHAGMDRGDDTNVVSNGYYVAIGVGAATEEELPGWAYRFNSNEETEGPWPQFPVFADIPSGTRLAMRISNAGSNEGGNYNGCIYGVS